MLDKENSYIFNIWVQDGGIPGESSAMQYCTGGGVGASEPS